MPKYYREAPKKFSAFMTIEEKKQIQNHIRKNNYSLLLSATMSISKNVNEKVGKDEVFYYFKIKIN